MHKVSSFVTLTYDEEHYKVSLEYRDFQQFMYRVRARYGPTRFFMGGEYGETTGRPHFHALLFGREFDRTNQVSEEAFESPALQSLWPFGFSSVGDVTLQSAQYVAKYCVKKITGKEAEAHYLRVDKQTGEYVYVQPEFGHMSLKPGLGYEWFSKYWKEVYGPRDGVPLKGGVVVPAPRYYDTLLFRQQLRRYGEIKNEREIRPERGGASLRSQEKVLIARQEFFTASKL